MEDKSTDKGSIYIGQIYADLGIKKEFLENPESERKLMSVMIGILYKLQDVRLKLDLRDILNGKKGCTPEQRDAIMELIKNSPTLNEEELKGKKDYSGIDIKEDENIVLQAYSKGHDIVQDGNAVVLVETVKNDENKDVVVETRFDSKEEALEFLEERAAEHEVGIGNVKNTIEGLSIEGIVKTGRETTIDEPDIEIQEDAPDKNTKDR